MATKPIKLDIDIAYDDRAWKRREPAIETLAGKTIRAALRGAKWPVDAPRAELSLVFTSDAAIQELNRDWRGKDKPTNVLSFPQFEGFETGNKMPVHLGDIVLAYQTVSREAKEQGKTFRAHLVHLLVHGVLHLLGYDHMASKEAKLMENLEVHILAGLGYDDPYVIDSIQTIDE